MPPVNVSKPAKCHECRVSLSPKSARVYQNGKRWCPACLYRAEVRDVERRTIPRPRVEREPLFPTDHRGSALDPTPSKT